MTIYLKKVRVKHSECEYCAAVSDIDLCNKIQDKIGKCALYEIYKKIDNPDTGEIVRAHLNKLRKETEKRAELFDIIKKKVRFSRLFCFDKDKKRCYFFRALMPDSFTCRIFDKNISKKRCKECIKIFGE